MIHSRPHVSAAIVQLRSGVTFCALLVVLCAVLQLLVFGFVHFTEVRWDQRPADSRTQTLSVIPTPRMAPPIRITPDPDRGSLVKDSAPSTLGAVRPVAQSPDEKGAAPAKVVELAQGESPAEATPLRAKPVAPMSPWDTKLRRISDVAVTGGVIFTLLLAVLCTTGTIIAGASQVPGVERAVSSSTWSLTLALFGLPWRDLMPSVPFPGIFSDYSAMIVASETVDAGRGSLATLLGMYLFMPLAALWIAMLVLARFRSGVEQGVIVTAPSELDEALEREMATIRRRGVAPAIGARAVGALNQAIGEAPPPPPAPAPLTGMRPIMSDPVEQPAKTRSWVSAHDRRMSDPDAGDPLKRPI